MSVASGSRDRELASGTSESASSSRSGVFDIAITGVGIVTPLGTGCSTNVERLAAGDSAVVTEVPAGVGASPAIALARCPDVDLTGLLRLPKALKYMSRPVRLAMRAAIEAFQSSGLQPGEIDPYRFAIYTASGQTGLDYTDFSRALDAAWSEDGEAGFEQIGGLPSRLIDRFFSLRTLGNGGIGLLAAELGAKGPSNNFVHSDTAAALALQAACFDILEGRADAAMVGAFDSLVYPTSLFALREAGMLTDNPDESGKILPAEGAAFFILERRENALDRGAGVLGEILGVECSVEATMYNPERSPGHSVRRLIHSLPDACQSFQFVVSPGDAPHWAIASEFQMSGPLARATGCLGAATAAVELALGLLCAGEGFVPCLRTVRESNDGGMAMLHEKSAPMETRDPVGIFFSRSASGQMAAIAARARSTSYGKAFRACAH